MKMLRGVVPYISHQVALPVAEYQLNIELQSNSRWDPLPSQLHTHLMVRLSIVPKSGFKEPTRKCVRSLLHPGMTSLLSPIHSIFIRVSQVCQACSVARCRCVCVTFSSAKLM